MKILLIGGSGCFGTEFIKICTDRKIKIHNYRSKDLDVRNFTKLQKKIKKIRPQIIINSSAIVGINQCEELYNNAFEVNTVGALNLAKICSSNKIILVQTSTHAVFDGKKKMPTMRAVFQNQTIYTVGQNTWLKNLFSRFVKNIILLDFLHYLEKGKINCLVLSTR